MLGFPKQSATVQCIEWPHIGIAGTEAKQFALTNFGHEGAWLRVSSWRGCLLPLVAETSGSSRLDNLGKRVQAKARCKRKASAAPVGPPVSQPRIQHAQNSVGGRTREIASNFVPWLHSLGLEPGLESGLDVGLGSPGQLLATAGFYPSPLPLPLLPFPLFDLASHTESKVGMAFPSHFFSPSEAQRPLQRMF